MSLLDMPIFGALKSRMQFHNARQVVLAENVANAETPGYEARDVKRPISQRWCRADRCAGLNR
jgi:flagellar basal-body rod protein FlgB